MTTDHVVHWREPRTASPTALVLALHGRGADETTMVPITDALTDRVAVASLRAPISEGAGYAWFLNRGIGRPQAESLATTIAWVRDWLDVAWPGPVYLLGFSGGTCTGGGLLLDDPARFAGAILLSGTLPFEAGVPTTLGRLAGVPVFHGHGADDAVIPSDLVDRTTDYLNGPSGAVTSENRYPRLGHTVHLPMLTDLVTWLDEQVPPLS